MLFGLAWFRRRGAFVCIYIYVHNTTQSIQALWPVPSTPHAHAAAVAAVAALGDDGKVYGLRFFLAEEGGDSGYRCALDYEVFAPLQVSSQCIALAPFSRESVHQSGSQGVVVLVVGGGGEGGGCTHNYKSTHPQTTP